MIIDYSKQTEKLIAVQGDKKRFIPIENILYIKCEGYLSIIPLKDGKRIYEIKTLLKFEKELSNFGFFRIRNNTIVNGRYITEVDSKTDKRTVKLGEICLIVAKSRLKSFLNGIM